MSKHEAIIQKERKYENHDLVVSDLPEVDFSIIRTAAIKRVVETPETNTTRAIIDAFMGYLASKGYRITKNDQD